MMDSGTADRGNIFGGPTILDFVDHAGHTALTVLARRNSVRILRCHFPTPDRSVIEADKAYWAKSLVYH